MELAAIQRIDIVATSNGVAQATAALEDLGRAHQGVAVASQSTERASLSLERRVESISRKFDQQYRAEQDLAKVERDLSAARAQGLIGLERQSQLLDLARQRTFGLSAANTNVAGSVDKLSVATRASTGSVGNMSAQLQDVGVQLAGGQSPFLIALQQGTQLSAALEQTGGGVKSLGAAFLSLVSPISLATIGGIALFGSLVQYVTSAGEKTQSLDDRLETHAGQIRKIKDAYGDAVQGLEVYERESNRVLEVQLRQTTERLKADLASLSASLINTTSTISQSLGGIEMGLPANIAGGVTEAAERYGAFTDAIVRLRNEAIAGEPNIRAFRESVATVGAASDDPRVSKMADELLSMSAQALKVESAINASARAVSALNSEAGAGVGDLAAYGKALERLSQIGLPNLTDRQKALQAYTEAVGKGGGLEDRIAAARAYEQAITRVGEREAEAAEKARSRGARSARRDEETFERAIITQQGRTRAMEEELRLTGLAGSELDAMRVRIELETAAKKRGIEVSDAMRGSIEREVEARRAASQALAVGRLDADIGFERAQIGRSTGEAQIASRLRSSGLGLDSAQADALRLNQTLSETKDLLASAATGFVADMRAGKSLAEALTNQANRLVDKLLEAALNKAISGLFAGITGGLGGGGAGMPLNILPVPSAKGNVFGGPGLIPFAKGGAFTNSVVSQPTVFPFAKGVGLMGEAGPEAIMPLRRNSAGQLGVVAANSNAAGGGISVRITNKTSTPMNEEPEAKFDGRNLEIMIEDRVRGLARSGALNRDLERSKVR